MKETLFSANMILYMETTGKKKMGKFRDKVNTLAEVRVHLTILYGTYLLNVLLGL